MKSSSVRIATIVCLVVLLFGVQATIQSMEMQSGQQSASARKVITPEGYIPTGSPFSPGIQVGDTLYVAGHLGRHPETRKIVDGGVEAETRQAMAGIQKVLEAAGMGFEDVASVTVYITDIGDFSAFNAVYGTYFPNDAPARATVQVAALSAGAKIELQMIAVKP